VSRGSRGVLPGIGENTIVAAGRDGKSETVHTFGWYLRKMIKDVQAKQAIPLVSGMTPRNSWRNNAFSSNYPMANDAQTVAKQEGVEYLDHTKYTVKRFQELGEKSVKAYFPQDSTHTNAAGARGMLFACLSNVRCSCFLANAETFVTAMKCAKSKAAPYISPRGQALTQRC
jgi:rhamnogalacturonan acetylesterase